MVDQLTLQTIGILLTGLTVSIAAVYYTLSLRYTRRNQELSLETRQIGLYMEFTKLVQQFVYDYTDVLYNQEWDSFEEYLQKYGPTSNPEEFNKFLKVADVYQSLGAFVEDGVFNIKTVFNHEGVWIIAAWEKMEPLIRGIRKLPEYARTHVNMFPQFEFLYNEIVKYREEHPELKT
jgi:hypothetical protein